MAIASARSQLAKSNSAFRTISEVAEYLDVPQHVLRFWETKFHQLKPLKRGGGRRYYRPQDVALLQRVRELLYTEGYTIRGVQRLLKQNSVKAFIRGEVGPIGADESDRPMAAPVTAGAPAGRRMLDPAAREELKAILAELTALRETLSSGAE